MNKNTPDRAAITYLTAVTVGMMVFAFVMAVTPYVSDVLFSWMIFGETGQPESFTNQAADYVVFSHAVLGAVMFGWFALVLWLVRNPLAAGYAGAWRALATALLAWFIVDTAMSLLLGYWQNAVLNTVVLGAYAPGLLWSRPGAARAVDPVPSRA